MKFWVIKGLFTLRKWKRKQKRLKKSEYNQRKQWQTSKKNFRFCFLFRLVRMGLKQGRTGKFPSLIASLQSLFTCSLSTCRFVASSVRADGVSINLDRNRYKWSAVGNLRLLSCAYKRKINRANLNHVSNLFYHHKTSTYWWSFRWQIYEVKSQFSQFHAVFRQTL